MVESLGAEIATRHIISVIPALASLCLVWDYYVFIDQGCGKTQVTATNLGTQWGQWPCRHFAARHHPVLGWRATTNGTDKLFKDYGQRDVFTDLQRRKFLRKYHHFSRWLTTSMLFIKKSLKALLQTAQLKASIPAEDRNSC